MKMLSCKRNKYRNEIIEGFNIIAIAREILITGEKSYDDNSYK